MNLHSFSSRGSGVCRSLFLRTFMVMMLFITGSNGIYAGEDLRATLPSSLTTFGSKGEWDGTNKYSWKAPWDNLMPIFTTITQGTLNTDYVALKFTTSDYTSQYRVCFMNGSKLVTTVPFKSAGEQTIELSKLGDLSQVDNIKFGGNSDNGSITLDPASIVLVGQLQNNTQRYDLSSFEELTNSSNVLSAKYDRTKEELVVKTKEAWGNYFPLYKDLNGTKRTGVRVTARGVKFRIIAKTSDGGNFKYVVPASDGDVTNHYKWEQFENQQGGHWGEKMTQADVAKIKEIGLAGDNAAGETDKVFYVKDFWLDVPIMIRLSHVTVKNMDNGTVNLSSIPQMEPLPYLKAVIPVMATITSF